MPHVQTISVFNNKGGVGKTTLTFHLAHALAEMGKRVLLVDLDPQCNLTIYGVDTEVLHAIWEEEDAFIDGIGFEASRSKLSSAEFAALNASPRTIHYLLKPTEEGTGELDVLPPPLTLAPNLDIIPGRLTLHLYENKIASRFNDTYAGDPLAIRTLTRVRTLVQAYAESRHYDFAIVDTSPSLGALNKIAISTVDGFLVPCAPDMFSLYGIRNIGNSLREWSKQFDTIYSLISRDKRAQFPPNYVRFLGFTIYNARRYAGSTPWDLAQAHYNYAQQIPSTVRDFIPEAVRAGLSAEQLETPIGGMSVMHSHNTMPTHAQKYNRPIWEVPRVTVDPEDRSTIRGNRSVYEATRLAYARFARAVIERLGEGDDG